MMQFKGIISYGQFAPAHRPPFILAEGLIPVSVGNIPLWGEIKGIKPECNSLAERTIPRTLCVGVRSFDKLLNAALVGLARLVVVHADKEQVARVCRK